MLQTGIAWGCIYYLVSNTDFLFNELHASIISLFRYSIRRNKALSSFTGRKGASFALLVEIWGTYRNYSLNYLYPFCKGLNFTPYILKGKWVIHPCSILSARLLTCMDLVWVPTKQTLVLVLKFCWWQKSLRLAQSIWWRLNPHLIPVYDGEEILILVETQSCCNVVSNREVFYASIESMAVPKLISHQKGITWVLRKT